MRAVLVGYDLMYDGTGRLVPIEMNTNVGYDAYNRAELEKDWQKPEALLQFIESEGIKKVYLDNKNGIFWHKGSYILEKLVEVLGEENVVKYKEGQDNPEDTEDNLIIRVDFSYDAQVDSYCRDKIAFLNLIKDDEAIGQEFMYKENGEVKGSLSFQDNGDYPNYVVKYRYPNYSSEYPKFYKFDSIEEVNALAESLEDDFLIMKAYFNNYSFWADESRFKELRSWDVITSTGETIKLGVYTKVTGKVDPSKDVWDNNTKELLQNRGSYLTSRWYHHIGGLTYLDSDDQVLMSDGVWKKASKVVAGDEILSLNIPFGEDVDISQHVGDYHITEQELKEGSTITINTVKKVTESETFLGVVHLLFEEDEEEWWDLAESSYPVEDPTDGSVMFKEIQDFKVGDVVYLLSPSIPNEINYIKRTVSDVWKERNIVSGYSITVDGSHLLITRSPESTADYVSIEHNPPGSGDIEPEPHGDCPDDDACCQQQQSYKICTKIGNPQNISAVGTWNDRSSFPWEMGTDPTTWAQTLCGGISNENYQWYCVEQATWVTLLEFLQEQYGGSLPTASLTVPEIIEYTGQHPVTTTIGESVGDFTDYQPWVMYDTETGGSVGGYRIQRYFMVPACAAMCQATGSLNS